VPKSGLNRRADSGKRATDERGGGVENEEGGGIKWRPTNRTERGSPAGVEAGEYWPELVGFEEGHAQVCTSLTHLLT